MTPTPSSKGEKKHWWLKDKKIGRIRLSTLYRLGLLFQAHCIKSPQDNNVPQFLLWLENYLEFNENGYEH